MLVQNLVPILHAQGGTYPPSHLQFVEGRIARLMEPFQGHRIMLARGMKSHLPPYIALLFGTKPCVQALPVGLRGSRQAARQTVNGEHGQFTARAALRVNGT